MFLTAVLFLCLRQQQDPLQLPKTSLLRELRLFSVDKVGQFTMIQSKNEKLDPPKVSPFNGWEFEHLSVGYARDTLEDNFNLRVRVFNQYRPDESDPTDFAARMLMRLWEFNRWRLNLDHTHFIYQNTIDVFLCAGGDPGAEQKVMEDPYQLDPSGNPVRVSNIYVYSVPTLTDRMEFARELAHEYGHATWPPMGGYEKPEQWVSGDMGERVFLMWMLQAYKQKKVAADDLMQVRLIDLQNYYIETVLPDLKRVATKGLDTKVLAGTDEYSYKEALGLVTYMAATLPSKVFGRALLLTKDRSASNFDEAVVEALTEAGLVEFSLPTGITSQAIWVPLGRGRIIGGKELRRNGSWVKIQRIAKKLTVQY